MFSLILRIWICTQLTASFSMPPHFSRLRNSFVTVFCRQARFGTLNRASFATENVCPRLRLVYFDFPGRVIPFLCFQ
jgi:hypothetical protein